VIKKILVYFEAKVRAPANGQQGANKLPVVIDNEGMQWTNNDICNWRNGFWPGDE